MTGHTTVADLSASGDRRNTRFHARAATAFTAVALLNLFLLWTFHNRYWYPVDEGIYSTIAERILAGEVLHVHIQDLHPGYGDFLNAAAFGLFGLDLVSLRYPLVAGAFLESVFVFALLARRSLLLASCGAVASIAVGVIHFLNPTAHWYALFGTCALLYWLTKVPQEHRARLFVAGLFVGIIGLVHQLVGVLVGTGVLVVALQERSVPAQGSRRVAQLLLFLPLVGLLVYLARSPAMEFSGVLLFAAWPVAILVRALRDTRVGNRDAVRVFLTLAAGAVLSSIPLFLYCAAHGSCGATVQESVFDAVSLGLSLAEAKPWYALLSLAGLYQALTPSTLSDIANGLYWTALPLLATINGLLTLTSERNPRAGVPVVPTVAAFYVVSSLYMQNAIYLHFGAGLSLTAILWWLSTRSRSSRIAAAASTLALASVAVAFHAGQPSTRTNVEMLRGRNVRSGAWAQPLERSTLRLDAAEQGPYAEVVDVIEKATPTAAYVFAVPNDPELYFLSRRRNPFRFYNTAIGIQNNADLAGVLDRLRTQPPALVTFRPADQYNTWASIDIMEFVRGHYHLIGSFNGVDVYRLAQ